MRTILFAAFLSSFLAFSGSAQEPKVRNSISTTGDLWVGQKVTFVVELLAPGFFAGSAAFDLPDTPGMLLAPPEGSPVVSSETIDNTSYTVQRHELAIFARRAGEQTIPSFRIRFSFKRNPLDKIPVTSVVKTEPIKFQTKVPPGAEKLAGLISARNLKVEEVWKPEPGAAKAGDAFTRTITYTAPDVPAMAFPPFPAPKIDGLGIYAKAPEVLDKSERGTLTGSRRDTFTYLCKRQGKFIIPATRLTWFDLDSGQLQTIEFPARVLNVAANPAMTSASKSEVHRTGNDYRDLILAVAVAFGTNVCAAALWKWRQRWLRCFELFRAVHLVSLNPGNIHLSS